MPSSRGNFCVRAAGFKWDKALGGRSSFSEKILKDQGKAKELLWKEEARSAEKEAVEKLEVPEGAVGDAFGKEMAGLTGGFPGGETGLKNFLKEYPVPPKTKLSAQLVQARIQLSEATAAAAARGAPAPVAPPLLMPGMTVMVTNPKDAYYQYIGIVQRITDGQAAVLFEGGNWDKLVTFDLTDLERTKKGPPGSNPKSGSLSLNPLFKKA